MTLREKITCLLRAIGRALSPRLTALEERIEALERHPFRYVGVWEAGGHSRGEFVTHRGSLWFCHAPTSSKPGTSDDWQLTVKAGKNGKDAQQ